MKKTRFLTAAALFAAALGLAGCGGKQDAPEARGGLCKTPTST